MQIPSQEFTYVRTYSRWLPGEQRRERYPETVDRYLRFMDESLDLGPSEINKGRQAILNMDVMPSMRALWAAGQAAKESNVTLYNCSYLTVSSIRAFSETLYMLMCGTGVGFSVESKYIDQLPILSAETWAHVHIVVEDSKIGWSESLDTLLQRLWLGHTVSVDYSRIRPQGSRLVTMGGRASGPGPLKDLFEFCVRLFEGKRARRQMRLTPIEALDIQNKIAEIVVVGGVRRSSEISLSDLNDSTIATAKMGEFWEQHPHRRMSNNSAVYEYKPDVLKFMEEFLSLVRSQSGERGMFNREGAIKQMSASGRRMPYNDVGTNPCGEVLLRDGQFCNLSEVIVRPTDTLDSLRKKVRIAAMFGTWQSSFTSFPYLRPQWAANCEEERLLGVSLTGLMDHPVLNNVNDRMKKWLGELKSAAIVENEKWAKRLGINQSTAITCIKPSGTVSQLTNCASGIHPRYSQYYIRRYRISANDPLYRMLRNQGVPWNPEVGEDPETAGTMVLDFPIESPSNSKTRHDYTALEQLNHWRVVKDFWAEHNPSITVYVGDDEWPAVSAWVYDNFDDVLGIAFLPRSNHIYRLAPYEEITGPEYEALAEAFPVIDYSKLSQYEQEDNTQGSQNYACVGDKCEI